MALIAVAADKGAPGVSTAVLALALSWPRPVLLAECDPAGADLPWRLAGESGTPLSQATGITSLTAASRGSLAGGAEVWSHVQRLDGGLPVLVGPTGPEQAEAIGGAWAAVAAALAAVPDVDVLADCGRVVTTGSPVVPVLQQADLVVLVTRPTVAGVAHLRHGITVVARALNAAGRGSGLTRIGVLVVDDGAGGRRAGARQVDQVLAATPGLDDVPVLGVLAHDVKAAAALAGIGWGGLARSALLRSAAPLARALVDRIDGADTPAPGSAGLHWSGRRSRA